MAQEDTATDWTVADDMHAPIVQTTSVGTTFWQAVYTPYGTIFSLSTRTPINRYGGPAKAEEFASAIRTD